MVFAMAEIGLICRMQLLGFFFKEIHDYFISLFASKYMILKKKKNCVLGN